MSKRVTTIVRAIMLGLSMGWALPGNCWGEPVVVNPQGGTPEERAKAKQALDEAVAEAKAIRKRVDECSDRLDDLEKAIEYEQPKASPVRTAKTEFKAAEAAYRASGFDRKKTPSSGSASAAGDKSVAKARMTVAREKYNSLRDEMLKNDPRWIEATQPLREVLKEQRDINALLERRRMECLALVGRIPGLYQPPPQDPRTAERLMLILATQAKEPWRPIVRVPPQPPQRPQNPRPYPPNQ